MGWSDRRGRLEAGLDADLAILAPDLTVVETWINGQRAQPQPLAV
jgi:N-acetylglucosamine-6-phosphate deacetylase